MINENGTDIPIYKDINFVLKNSKALILDIWGVLWDGIEVYPEAIDTLKKIKELDIPVILLSNAPRKASKVKQKLNAIGIKKEFYKEIISSGEICRSALLSRSFVVPGEHYYFIGLKEDKDLLSGSHFSEAKNMNSADFVLLTGPRSFNDTLSKYEDELTKCLNIISSLQKTNLYNDIDWIIRLFEKAIFLSNTKKDKIAIINALDEVISSNEKFTSSDYSKIIERLN